MTMSLAKQPWSALRLFDELMNGEGFFYPFAGFQPSTGAVRAPRVDVDVRDKDYVVSVELPGVQESDISVSVRDGELEITGERKAEQRNKDGQNELVTAAKFYRRVSIPHGVDPKEIKASLRDGILQVTVPAKPARSEAAKIPISRL